MALTLDNVFSGMVGAVLGVVASFWLNWFNRRRDSRIKLAEVLFEIRHSGYHDQIKTQTDQSQKIFSEHYLQVKTLTYAALYWCYPWERKRLHTAWINFKGTETSQFKECADQFDHVSNWKAFCDRIDPLLRFLEL